MINVHLINVCLIATKLFVRNFLTEKASNLVLFSAVTILQSYENV